MHEAPPSPTAQASVQIHPTASVADSATLGYGAIIEAGCVIGDLAHVGANAVVGARTPQTATDDATTVRQGAFIGANATVAAGVEIGERAVVRPGTVVARAVPRHAIVAGNPGEITGYVDTSGSRLHPERGTPAPGQDEVPVRESAVRGVTLHRFPVVPDLRGALTVGEFGPQVPFVPRRYFMVFDVPNAEVRGEHAHHVCHQFLLCVNGTLTVLVDDGVSREEFTLDDRHSGVYLPPLTWGIQYRYSADAVLLAFASHPYDPDDYIRDYDEFLRIVSGGA